MSERKSEKEGADVNDAAKMEAAKCVFRVLLLPASIRSSHFHPRGSHVHLAGSGGLAAADGADEGEQVAGVAAPVERLVRRAAERRAAREAEVRAEDLPGRRGSQTTAKTP